MNYLLKDKEIITCLFFIIVFNSSRDNLSERAIGILDKARTKFLLYLKIHCKRKYIDTQPLLYCHLLMKLADTSNLMDMNLEQIKKSERVHEVVLPGLEVFFLKDGRNHEKKRKKQQKMKK